MYKYNTKIQHTADDHKLIPAEAVDITRINEDGEVDTAFTRCESCSIPLFEGDPHVLYFDDVCECASCAAKPTGSEKPVKVLTKHWINACNEQLDIKAIDALGVGGANNAYLITGFDTATNPSVSEFDEYDLSVTHGRYGLCVLFQQGAPKDVGVNGITDEVLIAILIDRFEGFQKGPFNCAENAAALSMLEGVMYAVKSRAESRKLRGVEGTHQV